MPQNAALPPIREKTNMVSVSRARAEKQKKKRKAIGEQEKSERAINDKTARLKALRLAKEAEDQAEKSIK